MPTKRTRVTRKQGLRITPGAVELYRTGLRTQPHWDACRASSTINCTHPECDEYYETLHTLNMEFSIPPHQPSPLYSHDEILGYPDHERTLLIKKALDAALPAEITQEPKP
jgi:hypothetical protein